MNILQIKQARNLKNATRITSTTHSVRRTNIRQEYIILFPSNIYSVIIVPLISHSDTNLQRSNMIIGNNPPYVFVAIESSLTL